MANNKTVTLSVPPKGLKTLEEFCKVMGFSLLTTSQTIEKPFIDSWEDIYRAIESRLGPGSNGKDFFDMLVQVSLEGAVTYILTIVTDINHPDLFERQDILNELENPERHFDINVAEDVKIIRDKFLTLLNEGKGKQENQKRNTQKVRRD